MQKKLLLLPFAAVLATLLAACAEVIVGTALVTGIFAATDRRSSGTLIEDPTIQVKAEARISQALGSKVHVNVVSFNRVVLVTGEANSAASKAQITQVVRTVENVKAVVNEVEVTPASALFTRADDALITTKVKASLVDAKDIYASSFKVVTERGVVFMMGRVTQREGKRGADIARGVQGVVKVVKVFEYIEEAELTQMQKQPAVQKNDPHIGGPSP